MSNILTIKEAMDYLKISSYTTFKQNYVAEGLPVIIVGSNKRIDRSDLNAFVLKHKTNLKSE